MSKFNIKVARIEAVAGAEEDAQVRITFQVDRGSTTFQVPIFMSIGDFDDTEMFQAARSTYIERSLNSRHPKPELEAFIERPAAAFERELASKGITPSRQFFGRRAQGMQSLPGKS
jgi:hypothetical protein